MTSRKEKEKETCPKEEKEKEKEPEKEKPETSGTVVDSNKEDSAQASIEAEEAKKIVESITDSITGGEKQEREYCSFLKGRNRFKKGFFFK